MTPLELSARCGMPAIVADTSVLVPVVIDDAAGIAIANRLFHRPQLVCAPELMDLEVLQTLRRLERVGSVDAMRATRALHTLQRLRVTRYGHELLLPRIWQLRGHVTAYDAAYIALAEATRATLLTRDARLSSLSGKVQTTIEVI